MIRSIESFDIPDFPLQLLDPSSVVTATFSDSVLLSVPPCSLAGQQVSLTYQNMATKVTGKRESFFN